MRTCVGCGRTRPLGEYWRDGTLRSGKPRYKSRCRACSRLSGAEGEVRRGRRGGQVIDRLVDHLETLERQWGTGVPMAVVIESVLDRHPNLNPESLRRVFYRLIDRGVVVRERVGDEVRYRLNEAEAGG